MERRVRARSEITCDPTDSSPLYTYTEKKKLRSLTWHKTERILNSREYFDLLRAKNLALSTILKTRHAFTYQGQYFQLDEFTCPRNFKMLEVEPTDEQTEIVLPPFVQVVREVTDDKNYSNQMIAAGLL